MKRQRSSLLFGRKNLFNSYLFTLAVLPIGQFWIIGWIAPGWFVRTQWIHPILQNRPKQNCSRGKEFIFGFCKNLSIQDSTTEVSKRRKIIVPSLLKDPNIYVFLIITSICRICRFLLDYGTRVIYLSSALSWRSNILCPRQIQSPRSFGPSLGALQRATYSYIRSDAGQYQRYPAV